MVDTFVVEEVRAKVPYMPNRYGFSDVQRDIRMEEGREGACGQSVGIRGVVAQRTASIGATPGASRVRWGWLLVVGFGSRVARGLASLSRTRTAHRNRGLPLLPFACSIVAFYQIAFVSSRYTIRYTRV